MEHAGIHRAPPPRTLGLRRKLPAAALGCSRGPGCPTSAGEPELSRAQVGSEGSAGHLLVLPAQGEGGDIGNLSLSANKSMQVRLQGHLCQGRQLQPAGKSSRSCFPGGWRPRGWKNKPAVCTFWVCLVQYKWNRVGCSDTASTSPISGRRR